MVQKPHNYLEQCRNTRQDQLNEVEEAVGVVVNHVFLISLIDQNR
jgi:hypothetical protein